MARKPSTVTEENPTTEAPAAPAEVDIDLSTVQAAFAPDRAARALARPMRVTPDNRKPSQKYFDGLVKQGYDEWIAKGKPAAWADQPGIFVTVKTEDEENARKLARKAAYLYDVRLRFGLVTENKNDEGELDGTVTIVFSVTDKRVKTAGQAEANGSDADESETDESESGDESLTEDEGNLTDAIVGDSGVPFSDGTGDAPEWTTE